MGVLRWKRWAALVLLVACGPCCGRTSAADLSTGERVSILGVATSSSVILVAPFISGAAIP
jgi:hypothetical protein